MLGMKAILASLVDQAHLRGPNDERSKHTFTTRQRMYRVPASGHERALHTTGELNRRCLRPLVTATGSSSQRRRIRIDDA